MKTPAIIFIILLMFSCNEGVKNKKVKVDDTTCGVEYVIGKKAEFPCFDTSLIQMEKKFRIIYQEDARMDYVHIYREQELILSDSFSFDGIGVNQSVVDFNKDGYLDFLPTRFGNNPVSNLYLFDSINIVFAKIDDFAGYPEAQPVKGTENLYYSYHRSGCADANWDSDLFTIKNFKLIHLGNISGKECEEPGRVSVSKIVGTQSKILKVFPYQADKWSFIAGYWSRHYKLFTH